MENQRERGEERERFTRRFQVKKRREKKEIERRCG